MAKDSISQARISAREIIDRVQILEIMVALGFERPRRGTRTKCALHGGDGLSFSFSPAKGTWFCHATCGEGGGKIKLVQRALGVDSKSALRWIAELAGVQLEPWTEQQRGQYLKRREQATRETYEFLAWKRDMVEALQERRDVYLQAYHRCLRFILTHGLNHPKSDDIATMCERYEQRYQDMDMRIATVRRAPADVLLSYFRARRQERAA